MSLFRPLLKETLRLQGNLGEKKEDPPPHTHTLNPGVFSCPGKAEAAGTRSVASSPQPSLSQSLLHSSSFFPFLAYVKGQAIRDTQTN